MRSAKKVFVATLVLGLAACGGSSGNDDDVDGGGGSTRQLSRVEVTPPTATRGQGGTQQFAATAVYDNGDREALNNGVSWSSSTPAVASINANGLARALTAGETVVTAVYQGFSDTAQFIVTAPVIESVTVTPTPVSRSVGETQQFAATAHYSDNHDETPAPGVSWSSSVPAVASVNATGLANALTPGSTEIRATSGGQTGTAQLVVVAPGGGGNGDACAPVAGSTYDVCVRRTEFGIPHIKAENFASLAYGYAYAFAQDNICVIADSYVTVNAQRSRFFGPDAGYVFQGNGAAVNNLNSDFLFQQIIDEGRIEALLAQTPPSGPRPEVKEGVKGYVAGYNRYLRDVGVANLPDASCRGKPWVRPITEMDVYRRFYQLALLASTGVAIDGIGAAQPPATAAPSSASSSNSQTTTPQQSAALLKDRYSALAIGSNAVALGKNATANGRGMLLGNPHFPWQGSERFYQAHLTIPGSINVAGGSLFGVPLILIGHTDSMAWSHTVSTAFRFTPYELTLVPGTPTSYLVDGQPEAMTARAVSVQARKADGSLETRSRTLYSTRYGPMLTSILGLPIFPWTPVRAFALADANAANYRYLNHFFEFNQAKSSREALEILKRNQGIPWVNTIVADKAGEALYADISVTPNVPDAKAQICNTELGVATYELLGLPVLDGSRTSCAWDVDADAVQPGTFGPGKMPHLFRDDYVANMNDSYWLSSPRAPLPRFARIIGDWEKPRALRTRLGLVMIEQELAQDGKFTRQELQDLVFNNRQYAGELWRDALAGLCEQLPGGFEMSSAGPINVSEACPALAAWNLRDDLDSDGAILFRRFASRLLGVLPVAPGDTLSPPAKLLMFSEPFDANDPVNTPRGLNVLSPLVHQALGDAVNDLNSAGIPLTAPLLGFQFEKRGDEKIPIHGGPGSVGVFNAINVSWRPPEGYPDVSHGSSYVQVVSFTDGACPDVRTILTYSQSTNPASPHFADQTRLFSSKVWVQPPFCEADVLAAPGLSVLRLSE